MFPISEMGGGVASHPATTVESLFNEVLDITNDILRPGESYSEMYGTQPFYNEPRYNEIFDLTNIISPNVKSSSI